MARDNDRSTPTIRNATCGDCGADEEPFRVTGREHDIQPKAEEPEDSYVRREVVCEHCGAEASVEVTRAGTSIEGPLVPSWMGFEEGKEQASEEESEPAESEGEGLSEAQEALFG